MALSKKVYGDGAEIDQLMGDLDVHSTWSSPEAFSRHIKSLDHNKAWYGNDNAWTTHDERFTGVKTMDEALHLAAGNWNDGAEKVEKLRARIAAARPMGPRLIKYGIAGSVPCVPRAVAGNIFNMKQNDLGKARKKPIITLLCNMSANCVVDKEAITNRAASVAAIIDQIEASGYSVEVISTALSSSGYGNKFNAATSIIAKPAHQPTDIKRLAFALGHAAMFRRLVFGDWEAVEDFRPLGMGLGHAHDMDNKGSEEWEQKAIYKVPSANDRAELFKTEELAMTKGLDYLMESLHQQKCPAFKERTWEEPVKKKLGFEPLEF